MAVGTYHILWWWCWRWWWQLPPMLRCAKNARRPIKLKLINKKFNTRTAKFVGVSEIPYHWRVSVRSWQSDPAASCVLVCVCVRLWFRATRNRRLIVLIVGGFRLSTGAHTRGGYIRCAYKLCLDIALLYIWVRSILKPHHKSYAGPVGFRSKESTSVWVFGQSKILPIHPTRADKHSCNSVKEFHYRNVMIVLDFVKILLYYFYFIVQWVVW